MPACIWEPLSRGFQRGIISGLEIELTGGTAFISWNASVTREGVGLTVANVPRWGHRALSIRYI